MIRGSAGLRDRLVSLGAPSAANGAFAVINGVQQLDPAQRVIGIATAFKHFTEALGLDPREVLYIVARMERDCTYRADNTLNAVKQYVEHELKAVL